MKIFRNSKEIWFFKSSLLKKPKQHTLLLLLYNLRCLKGCGKCPNAFHQYQYRHLIKISSIYALGKVIQLWRFWKQTLLNAKILLLIVQSWKIIYTLLHGLKITVNYAVGPCHILNATQVQQPRTSRQEPHYFHSGNQKWSWKIEVKELYGNHNSNRSSRI